LKKRNKQSAFKSGRGASLKHRRKVSAARSSSIIPAMNLILPD